MFKLFLRAWFIWFGIITNYYRYYDISATATHMTFTYNWVSAMVSAQQHSVKAKNL